MTTGTTRPSLALIESLQCTEFERCLEMVNAISAADDFKETTAAIDAGSKDERVTGAHCAATTTEQGDDECPQ